MIFLHFTSKLKNYPIPKQKGTNIFFMPSYFIVYLNSQKNRTMKKIILSILLVSITIFSFSQQFFNEEFNHRKKYLILTNPTVRNIQTMNFLVSRDLLQIRTNKVKFVGIYHEGQNYDFSKTKDYIEKNGLSNYYLHEVKGKLTEDNVFTKNGCSGDIETIFKNSIGVFFFGGPDIPPGIYGEENTLSVVTDPGRHLFEVTTMFHLLGGSQNKGFEALLKSNPKYLVTGFCLGLQTMNVATGGTLIQDIPSEIYHAYTAEDALTIGRRDLHRNYWQEIDEDTLLMGINLHTIQFSEHPFFGQTIKMAKGWHPRVYSSHHQAIENLGQGLKVTAWSPDQKIIEGVAHQNYKNVFSVQFHPEVPALYEDLFEKKFHPEDRPMTYHEMIGKQSVKFHEKYWEHISEVIKKL